MKVPAVSLCVCLISVKVLLISPHCLITNTDVQGGGRNAISYACLLQFGEEAVLFIFTPVSVIDISVHVLPGQIHEGSLFWCCALDWSTKLREEKVAGIHTN